MFECFFFFEGFPDSSVGKESACSAGHPGSIPGLGRSAGERIGYPLQYSWTSHVAQLVISSKIFFEENMYWKAIVSYLTYTILLVPHKTTPWIWWALQMRSGTFSGVWLWTRILRITGFNNSPLSIQLINGGDVNRNLMSLLLLDDTLK